MKNQSYDTQKFKRVIMHHQDFSLQQVETQAYTFITYDRRHYINIGDGYAIIRPKDISNYQYISDSHIIKIKDYYHKIVRVKNQKGHVIAMMNQNTAVLKRVKLVRK